MFRMKKAHSFGIYLLVCSTYARVSVYIVGMRLYVCVHLACERHYSNLMRQRWIINKPPPKQNPHEMNNDSGSSSSNSASATTAIARLKLKQPSAVASLHNTTYTYKYAIIILSILSLFLFSWYVDSSERMTLKWAAHHIKANQIAAVTPNIIVSGMNVQRARKRLLGMWWNGGADQLWTVQRNRGNAFNGFSNPKTRFVMIKKMEFI